MIVTPPPAPEPIRFETLLSLSWSLFRRNWIVALPPVIAMVIIVAATVGFIAAVAVAALGHGGIERGGSPPAGPLLLGVLAYAVVALALGLWSYAAMYGMADAAWANGTATFGDGFAAFRTRAGALIVAFIGVFGIAIAAVIVALPTLALSLLALPLVLMYVGPAVVTGRRGGFAAIGESFRLVRRFFGTSAIALLVLLGIQYGISMLASLPLYPLEFAMLPSPGQTTPHMPAVGLVVGTGLWFIVAMIVAQAYTGYYTIALVGLYRSLSAQPAAAQPPGPVLSA